MTHDAIIKHEKNNKLPCTVALAMLVSGAALLYNFQGDVLPPLDQQTVPTTREPVRYGSAAEYDPAAARIRENIQLKSDFGYDPRDEWTSRKRALERLACIDGLSASPEMIDDIFTIAQHEDNMRVKAMAVDLLLAYDVRGGTFDTNARFNADCTYIDFNF